MPILDNLGEFIVIKNGSIDLKPVPYVPTSMNQHGFYYEGVKIKILNWYPFDSMCGGLMCDGLGKTGFLLLPCHFFVFW